MVTPRREQIRKRAIELFEQRGAQAGLPAITPEEYELKESGLWNEAQVDLMSTGGETSVFSDTYEQQRKYLNDMAQEMGLQILSKREYLELQRMSKKGAREVIKKAPKKVKKKRQKKMRWPVVVAKPAPTRDLLRGPPMIGLKGGVVVPSAAEIIGVKADRKPVHVLPQVGRKKKRKRSHVDRTGKTMRALRKIDGVKVFSFPDHVWKVRQVGKKKKAKKKR